ncbi:hypothetical protein [Anaerotruncus sp.]|uniref:hypothetical protein n=1 Tax=Anaerotruncus sp. TaxID=1872531 RepID=UPI0025BA93A7|nr:hypothetical protein [Anaerotruncus sp.]
MKKGLSEKLPTFFEKKVGQKTLVGCAANSGLGASQLKVFARLSGLFEKRPQRKTLVGCAANSGAGSGIYAGCAANSGAGAVK